MRTAFIEPPREQLNLRRAHGLYGRSANDGGGSALGGAKPVQALAEPDDFADHDQQWTRQLLRKLARVRKRTLDDRLRCRRARADQRDGRVRGPAPPEPPPPD